MNVRSLRMLAGSDSASVGLIEARCTRVTDHPHAASSCATPLPAGPPPTTTTSHGPAARITRARYAARRVESTLCWRRRTQNHPGPPEKDGISACSVVAARIVSSPQVDRRHVSGRIRDSGCHEGIVPLAAFAARAAMPGTRLAVRVLRAHARQGQLERHLQSGADPDDLRFAA